MIGSLDDLTALIAALGVLIAAFGTSAVKIGKCLSDIRRQTARVQSTATATKREVVNQQEVTAGQLEHVGDTVQTLSAAFVTRMGVLDSRLERIAIRLERLERQDEST